jgi:hypothetical protein
MKHSKAFFVTFTVSLMVLGLGAGLFTVGYNSRKVAQGEQDPPLSYGLQKGRFVVTDSNGNQIVLGVIEEENDRTALIAAPTRVTAHILRGVTAALYAAAEKLEKKSGVA